MNEVDEFTIEDECDVCAQLVDEVPGDRKYSVVPAHGGGWEAWSAAFLRLLRRIGPEPTQALIVTQESVTQRFVQAMIGHGIASVEASSNVFLMDESRLSSEHEELLVALGWQRHSPLEHDPDGLSPNWHLPNVHGDWTYLTEMFLATMVGIFGFSEHAPVEIRTFAADSLCKSCSWPEEA